MRLRRPVASWTFRSIACLADRDGDHKISLDRCQDERLDFIFGVAPTSTLRRHIAGLNASTKARFEAASKGGRRAVSRGFLHAAKNWSDPGGADVDFIKKLLDVSRPRKALRM
jgi:hypothetical protein